MTTEELVHRATNAERSNRALDQECEMLRRLVKRLQAENEAIRKAGAGVLHSHENYTSEHEPESEWDEYDQMIFPLWAALRAVLAVEEMNRC